MVELVVTKLSGDEFKMIVDPLWDLETIKQKVSRVANFCVCQLQLLYGTSVLPSSGRLAWHVGGKHIGVTLTCLRRLIPAGLTAAELRAQGFCAICLAGRGFSATELSAAGFQAEELRAAGFNAHQLRAAGLRVADLRTVGYTVEQLRDDAGFSIAELLRGGFNLRQLREAGSCLDFNALQFATDRL